MSRAHCFDPTTTTRLVYKKEKLGAQNNENVETDEAESLENTDKAK